MAISNKTTLRRELPKAVDYLSPSTQISVGGGPSSPALRASQFIAPPTPYVGKAAVNTELLDLAKSLGQFNKQIGTLAYVIDEESEQRAEEQGKEDAMANTDLARDIFKKTLDKSVKEGLFPKNAHPGYRMAYMETAAKAITMQDLPTFLEEQAKSLEDPNNMEPVGPKLRTLTQDYLSNQFPDPIARNAAMAASFSIVNEVQARTSKNREDNFVSAETQGIEQLGTGVVSQISRNFTDPNDENQQRLRYDGLQQYQNLYNNIQLRNPHLGPKSADMMADILVSSVRADIFNGTLDPQAGLDVLDFVSSGLKSGTGPWANIPSVSARITGAKAELMNRAAMVDNQRVEANKDNYEKFENEIQTYLFKENASGTLRDADFEGRYSDQVSKIAAEFGYTDIANDPFELADEQLSAFDKKTVEYQSREVGLSENLNALIENGDLTEAMAELRATKELYPRATYEAEEKRIADKLNVLSDLENGDFDSKNNTIRKTAAEFLGAAETTLAAFIGDVPIKSDMVIQHAELQTFGEQEFRRLALDNVETSLRKDPALKEPERVGEYTQVVNDAVNAAYKDTLNLMKEKSAKIKKESDDIKAGLKTSNAENIALYGEANFSLIDAVKTASMALDDIDDPKSTRDTLQIAEYKREIANVKNQLPRMANQIRMSSGDEQVKLKATYTELRKLTGLGVDAVLSGRTEDGIDIDVNSLGDIKELPVFRSKEEFLAVVDEDRAADKADGSVYRENALIDFVIQEEAGGRNGPNFYSQPTNDYKQKTIGYGTKAKGPSDRVTPAEAEERLKEALEEKAIQVLAAADKVGIMLGENQLNALISLQFNSGEASNFILASKGNDNWQEYIRSQIPTVNGVTRTPDGRKLAKKKVLPGLVARRQRELDLFNTPDQSSVPQRTEKTRLERLKELAKIESDAELQQFMFTQSNFIKQRDIPSL
jgi:GH24 family phage-related lysozyme (muramidase)